MDGFPTVVSVRALVAVIPCLRAQFRFNPPMRKPRVTDRATSLALLVAIMMATCGPLHAQSPTPPLSPAQPPANYDLRWGVKIAMRDMVELNATLYVPKTPDGSAPKTPVIFTLTPYISDTYHARGAYFASHGYTFALVDVRGPREFRRRIRAVRKRTTRRTRPGRVAGQATVL